MGEKMNKLFFLLLVLLFICGCTNKGEDAIYHGKRDRIIDVHDQMKEIHLDNVLISGTNRLFTINSYLVVEDYKSMDNLIYLFDLISFELLAQTAPFGQGPGEISNIGHIAVDEQQNNLYVSDHGKQKIFIYPIDSILSNDSYIPSVKIEMKAELFPSEYQYLNDTVCIARIIKPIGNNDYEPLIARWNMNTGEILPFQYKNEKLRKKRMTTAVSLEANRCVECYSNYDLITIYDLDGSLIHNVYGPSWGKEVHYGYFQKAIICKNWIIASIYPQEDDYSKKNKNKLPTQLIIMDTDGNYIQTLETGYNIIDFCFDKKQERLILSLDDECQFAFLDMRNVVDMNINKFPNDYR